MMEKVSSIPKVPDMTPPIYPSVVQSGEYFFRCSDEGGGLSREMRFLFVIPLVTEGWPEFLFSLFLLRLKDDEGLMMGYDVLYS